MHIGSLLNRQEPFLSLEFFPPKDRGQWPGFFDVVRQLKTLAPLFCSVTYGAGGSTQHNTLEIVARMKQEYGLEPLAHLTCVGADVARLASFMRGLNEARVDNVLALRGDPPRRDGLCSGQRRFPAWERPGKLHPQGLSIVQHRRGGVP